MFCSAFTLSLLNLFYPESVKPCLAVLYEMSNLLNTGLDKKTLSILIELCGASKSLTLIAVFIYIYVYIHIYAYIYK